VPGSKGTNVYQAVDPDGPYTRVYHAPYTTRPGEFDYIFSCTINNLEPGKKYYYRLKAYIIVNGIDVEGIVSNICDVTPVPKVVEDIYAEYSKNSSNQYRIIVRFRPDEKCDGYEVYRAEGESDDFIQGYTVEEYRSTTSSYMQYFDTDMPNYTVLFKYKIRPYVIWQEKKIFGPFSKIVQRLNN
jgi:hypothetical protein